MMDTVYGTKKYFQSLSGGSDIYRSSTCRAVGNDYTSYQNTLGRRSALAPPYTHMNKHPTYSTDLSLGSQYAYSTWGMWRDPRNLSPSTYSSKSRQSIKSFSIILTTAAFIVLLAVISIAGLAFYFSTFKSNLEDPIMVFEGRFRIAKGDLFTTGLKYNHTSSFKQKVDFYKRFIERGLSDNGLQPVRVDVIGFGDGPLINVQFRTFLDIRKLPQNVHSVEDHIRESLFLETTSAKSLYKSLRIESDSVEVKRILDEELIKSASFSKEALPPTSQTHFEKRLTKKTGTIEKASPKISTVSTTQRPKIKAADDEPDVDVENAPVIQGSFEGSFEITKTDADITRKKTSPTKSVTTSTKPTAQTAFSMKPKTKKTTIEKVTRITENPFIRTTPALTTIAKNAQSTTTATKATTTPSSTTLSTTTTTTTTTTMKPSTTTQATTMPTSSTTRDVLSTTAAAASTTVSASKSSNPSPQSPSITASSSITNMEEHLSKYSNVQDPPKLDANLFTSAPVLDTEPWRPIRPNHSPISPSLAQNNKNINTNTNNGNNNNNNQNPSILNHANNMKPIFNIHSQSALDAIESGLLPRNKIKFTDKATEDPNKMIFYHSFTNPVFMPESAGIEKLGNSDVKPHPLPVPLLDDVIIPEFKPIGISNSAIGSMGNFPVEIQTDDKFEHIGGGVIVKKHDNSSLKIENEDNLMDDIDELLIRQKNITMISSSTIPTSDITTPSTKIIEELPPSYSTDEILQNETQEESIAANLSEKIGEILLDLLEIPKEDDNNTESLNMESRIEPEMDVKPNFLNIREHILNKTTTIPKEATTTTSTTITTTTTTTITTTTATPAPTSEMPSTSKPTLRTKQSTTTISPMKIIESTTKKTKIPTPTLSSSDSGKTTPVTMDDSLLFPSHSKWEYVNGSSNVLSSTMSNSMRKVFNDTLQAWVVENVDRPENISLKNFKIQKNNTDDIQNISLIFDTLAAKLGISPTMPTKVPPFVAFAQNKFKQNSQKNNTRNKFKIGTTLRPVTIARRTTTKFNSTLFPLSITRQTTKSTTTRPPRSTTMRTTTIRRIRTTTTPTTTTPTPTPSTTPINLMLAILDQAENPNSSPEVIVGEAEVEVVDPTQYEEMLSSQTASSSTIQSPTLVTLLPVRSNSGIRTFRPPINVGESRRFNNNGPRYREAVVKTGIHVTA